GYYYIKSESRAGSATIDFFLQNYTPPEDVPQIWDEMRRKVNDLLPRLPPGIASVNINDDFGDVFGYYFALTADEGYSYEEMEDYADFIKKNIITAPDVKRIELFGIQKRVVNIRVSNEKLANSGIIPGQIIQTLNAQNKLINTGKLEVDPNEIQVDVSGTFESLEEIEELVLPGSDGRLFRLNELAIIEKDFMDPEVIKMRVNGKRAIAIGVSTRQGGNAVLMGDAITAKIDQIKGQLPLGIDIAGLYYQDRIAAEANKDFILNLIISIAIVVVLILFAMGLKPGLLIGSGLLFSIIGTVALMQPLAIEFHRTSLAAFIVAMGMLVDNAIVVTDNAQMNMRLGMNKQDALIKGAYQPQWGLFGATLIAILSFLPLYVAKASTAELMAPFFVVLGISLFLSWIFALTQTTVYGNFMLKSPKTTGGDPYGSKFYKRLEGIIEWTIRKKWLMFAFSFLLFITSLFLFRFIKRDFIPPLVKPVFRMDYLLPQGTSIATTESRVAEIEEFLMEDENIKTVSVSIGSSPLRYYLASKSFTVRPNFANFTIEMNDADYVDGKMKELREFILNNQPDAMPLLAKFIVSAQPEAQVEALFKGPNADTLRALTNEALKIMREEPMAEFVRSSWGNKVGSWSPVYSQTKGQQAYISRENMANALLRLTEGQHVGFYREGDRNMPILVKDNRKDNYDLGNVGALTIINPKGEVIFLDQVVENYNLEFKDWVIRRHNRERAMAAQCEPVAGIKNPELEAAIVPKIEAIPLPEGYSLMWDGMKFKQAESVGAILAPFPMALVLIITILIVLFNSFKKTLIIFYMVPLLLVGVVPALLLSGMYFSFFCILALLGLIGMVIKNAIVLIDQSDIEMRDNNRSRYDAIVFAAKARAVPVAMAAGTTIMGMLPLLPDPLFGSLAVTIMGGLFGSTLLTIFVLPPIYAIFYKLRKSEAKPDTL
ncbi:MAG: efflux RND transporter permease subunit, partial [Cyclobacteriaceae bacterium]